jgi:glyoxylase-like metal-dependent hydrolase (beta-lactamase superfamily II)
MSQAPATKPHYPFEAPPPSGQTLEVAPGVRWIRMPLPYTLNHINLWAIDDGAGWALVDTGTRTDNNIEVWRALWAHAPDQRSLSRVLVTHMHPDHIGMAGWLTRKFGIELWMTRLEYLSCRVMVSDTGREAPPDGIAFYQRAGWSDTALEHYRLRFGNFGKHIHTMPDAYQRLHDGQRLRIGAHDWRVITTAGHSPEHACLYCPDLKLLISGDQVLPRISSNVSVYPIEPEADPMREWLASLDRLQREVPDDVLVLPSHNEPFTGLHARLDALRQGHVHNFEQLLERLAEPCRTTEVFATLFNRPITENDVHLLGMATGEAVACLNHLMHQGLIRRTLDADGVYRYQRC